jgi:hypothetical protein
MSKRRDLRRFHRRRRQRERQQIKRSEAKRLKIQELRRASLEPKNFRRIFAPEEFSILNIRHLRTVLWFVEDVRQTLCEGLDVQLSFAHTKRLQPDGTLYLLAEIDRLQRIFSRRTIRSSHPPDRVVHQVFDHIGLSDLLRVRKLDSDGDLPENVRHWRFISSDLVEASGFDPWLEHIEQHGGVDLKDALSKALSEAVTNCGCHAYEQDRLDGLQWTEKRWWAFYQTLGTTHSVFVCDLGIGIHRSMEQSKSWGFALEKHVKGVFSPSPIAREIAFAVERQESSTNEQHRGHGLGEVRRVIEERGKGNLVIRSGRGIYTYSPERAAHEVTQLLDLDVDIMATIISWQIVLDPQAHT